MITDKEKAVKAKEFLSIISEDISKYLMDIKKEYPEVIFRYNLYVGTPNWNQFDVRPSGVRDLGLINTGAIELCDLYDKMISKLIP